MKSMEFDGVKEEKTEEEFSPMEVGREKKYFFLFFPVCDGRWIGYANSPRLRDEVKSSIVFGVRGTLRSRSLFGGEREKCCYTYPLALSRDLGLKFFGLWSQNIAGFSPLTVDETLELSPSHNPRFLFFFRPKIFLW